MVDQIGSISSLCGRRNRGGRGGRACSIGGEKSVKLSLAEGEGGGIGKLTPPISSHLPPSVCHGLCNRPQTAAAESECRKSAVRISLVQLLAV
jgi:hypothetical protein